MVETEGFAEGCVGMLNMRHFYELGDMQLKIAKRYERPICLVILSVDFKLVQDIYGSDAADVALKHMAAICAQSIRETDLFGRLGEKEFGLLLLETSAKDAQVVAKRVCDEMDTASVNYFNKPIGFNVSQSVCVITPTAQYPTLRRMHAAVDHELLAVQESGVGVGIR